MAPKQANNSRAALSMYTGHCITVCNCQKEDCVFLFSDAKLGWQQPVPFQ